MHFFDILREDIRRFFKRRRIFALDHETAQSLRLLAEKKRATTGDVLEELVQAAATEDEIGQYAMERWDMLSDRERQVAALICKKMTNKEIAAVMGVSDTTVKTYVERVMVKFNIHRRQELRNLLSGYDLTPFE